MYFVQERGERGPMYDYLMDRGLSLAGMEDIPL